MAKPDSVQERPYHHGDLRRAIVRAALEILSETQSLECSQRELLAAVSTAGFELLTKRMSEKSSALSNARTQLFAMLRAYIHHGVENPALYRLMFGGYLSGPDDDRPA